MDKRIYEILDKEIDRQSSTVELIANLPAVLPASLRSP